MIYPLQHAIGRNQLLAYASGQAVDRAMRKLHDMPNMAEQIPRLMAAVDERLGRVGPRPEDIDRTVYLFRAEAARRYHVRMKTDETNCRWCGTAAAEARAELEAADVDLLA